MSRFAVPTAALLILAGAAALLRIEFRSLAAEHNPAAKKDETKKDETKKDETKKEPELLPLKAFMRAKLAASEKILDGLVTEDFEKITDGTLRMQIMTKASEWKVSESQEYLDQSAEFRKILSRLKNQSQKKNLDGSALAYVEMTMSCVRCHEALRLPAPRPKPGD